MKGDSDKFEQQVANLADALADNILAGSDEEILGEDLAPCADTQAVKKHVQELIERARIKAGKARMAQARAAAATDQQKPLRVFSFSLEDKKRLLQKFASSDDGLRNTLAARKGKDLPENDIDGALQALYELGVIDEHGRER